MGKYVELGTYRTCWIDFTGKKKGLADHDSTLEAEHGRAAWWSRVWREGWASELYPDAQQ